MSPSRPPLYYTFGNHMHWVDMQWLWGYGVLPGSTSDMLTLCREAGTRGNVNFDVIGYEKMAGECPEALADLRRAIAEGTIEPVGCSYGQPYGLFQGGESNVRQFIYGAAGVRRLLGVRPRTFWEEEFYFYPQLPQVLRACGFTGASLFFQWTWHTPEVPKERASLIEWEGIDGTRIPTLPRNDLNVHQWPEDFDGLLEQGLVRELERPAVVQWLELMPSKDWMCRSEVLLPRLKQLMSDPRFDVRPRTAGQLIEELKADAAARRVAVPVRKYGPDDVWHGMTLGKNADAHPRASARAEQAILAAEALSTVASVMGRPYASWDVYPTWELEEAWRETLAAQHHDNHECEGLCGFVGHGQFYRAEKIAQEVGGRATWLLTRRGKANRGDVVTNCLGWSRRISQARHMKSPTVAHVPPFGYGLSQHSETPASAVRVRTTPRDFRLTRGRVTVTVSRRTGRITQILASGRDCLGPGAELFGPRMTLDGAPLRFDRPRVTLLKDGKARGIRVSHRVGKSQRVDLWYWLLEERDGLKVIISRDDDENVYPFGPRPDAGLNAALQVELRPGITPRVIADSPYAMQEVRGSGSCRRKYPTGDWMTSPQWFEEVQQPFTSTSLVDLLDGDGSGLLVVHDGSQQWFRDENGVRVVLTAYDPWDEGRYNGDDRAQFCLIPHEDTLTHASRAKLAAEAFASAGDWFDDTAVPVGGGTGGIDTKLAPIPKSFGMLEVCEAPGVLAHALYRDSEKTGEHLPAWAGHEMARRSEGACTHPVVVRLVEWNGEPAEVTLKLPGPVAAAAKTNLLGEVGDDVGGGSDTAWLKVEPAKPPAWARGVKIGGRAVTWSQVRFTMRPREIATIMADVVMARKEWRDLDEKRKVWATVHKVEATKRRSDQRRRG